jgi:hypothetical protein
MGFAMHISSGLNARVAWTSTSRFGSFIRPGHAEKFLVEHFLFHGALWNIRVCSTIGIALLGVM